MDKKDKNKHEEKDKDEEKQKKEHPGVIERKPQSREPQSPEQGTVDIEYRKVGCLQKTVNIWPTSSPRSPKQ